MGTIISFLRTTADRKRSEAAEREQLQSPSEDDHLLLEAGRQEVQNIAILTAITASALNFYGGSTPHAIAKDVGRYLPAEPVILPVLFRRLATSATPANARYLFENLATHLRHAKRFLRSFMSPSPDGRSREQAAELCATWRMVAESALLALYEIDRISDHEPSSDWQRSFQLLNDVLIAARDGGAPCLIEGRPAMPTWAQRRRHHRVPVNMDAAIRYHGKSRAVRVTDLSQGGLGLDRAEGLKVGEIVLVTLAIGRRMIGSVVWTNGARVGITFSSELAADDPLISSG